MKTTLIIPDPVYRQIKQLMAKRGLNFKEFMLVALRQFLNSQKHEKKKYGWEPKPFQGDGLVNELQGAGWEEIRARAYEGHGG